MPKTLLVSLHAIEIRNGKTAALVFKDSNGTMHRRTYQMPDFMVAVLYLMMDNRDERMMGLEQLGVMARPVSCRAEVYDLRSDDGKVLNLGSDENVQLLFSLLREGSANVGRIRQTLRDDSSITIHARP